jgi:hypothetical protein
MRVTSSLATGGATSTPTPADPTVGRVVSSVALTPPHDTDGLHMTAGPRYRQPDVSRLLLYTDQAYKPRDVPHAPVLYPFWGAPPGAGRYDRYNERGPDYIQLVPLDSAQAAVLPAAWEHVAGNPEAESLAARLAERCRAAELPLLVFFFADSIEPVPIEEALVLRTSLLRSAHRETEHAMPAISIDVGEELGGDVEPSWRETPVVGFCGYAPGAERLSLRAAPRRARRRLRVAVGSLPDGIYARARALAALRASPRVKLNDVVRDSFWAGALRPDGTFDRERMEVARTEFVSNMRDSDYILCSRGGGNFSYRLYETMSASRIPVFVDTDSVLPFEQQIDWRSLCVWIDASDVESVGDAVAEEHRRLGPDGFRARCADCRRTWETYLSAEGFFGHLNLFLPSPATR